MSKLAIGRSPEANLRNRRLGLALAALTLTYIAAVIGFLVFK
jgi:hypothetical protein